VSDLAASGTFVFPVCAWFLLSEKCLTLLLDASVVIVLLFFAKSSWEETGSTACLWTTSSDVIGKAISCVALIFPV